MVCSRSTRVPKRRLLEMRATPIECSTCLLYTSEPVTSASGGAYSSSTASGWQEGLVLGGGVQFKILMIKVSGELRWSRYGNISVSSLPKLNANQAELLIGIGL